MDSMANPLADVFSEKRDKFLERMLASASGTFEIFSIFIGDKLGFYSALAKHNGLTPDELAGNTGNHPRYVREWLEQQVVVGILEVKKEEVSRFYIPPWVAEVLVDKESLNYLAPLARLIAGVVRPLEEVIKAYKEGGGVAYSRYGADMREGQAAMNRTMFLQLLGQEWLPAIPDLNKRLASDPPARVAEIGCGAGWASIGIAQNYPQVRVDGFDLDQPSIEMAQANAKEAGVADRVTFEVRDATDPKYQEQYDLVAVFEALHDMSQPVAALQAMRQLVNKNGVVLVVDENVGESFDSEWGQMDSMMYGWSILHCLPVGMSEQPSAATGTVFRSATLRQYAQQAGFRDIAVLPIDNLFFRFYRLIAA